MLADLFSNDNCGNLFLFTAKSLYKEDSCSLCTTVYVGFDMLVCVIIPSPVVSEVAGESGQP